MPAGFDPNSPKSTDWPSMIAVAGRMLPARNNLPPAVVLPEKLIHTTGRVLHGQFGGMMGPRHDPWFVEASPYDNASYGAYPEYGFDHQERPEASKNRPFQAPSLGLPADFGADRLDDRLGLLEQIDRQRGALERFAETERFDGFRQGAVSLLSDPKVKRAFDVVHADPKTLDRYGRNSFGWSLLMARRLVEAGVNLVQVNLGNNETWDTHGNAFPHLKERLLPPTDRAVSALLDDLHESGLLDSTLIVMAGEFGRTPRISSLPQYYKLPGATTGVRSRRSSSPGEVSWEGESSARPTRSAAIPPPTRRPPRPWPPRSTGPWGSPPRPRGSMRRIGPTSSITETRSRGWPDAKSRPRARSKPREETATCRKERRRWRYLRHLGAHG